MDLIPHHLAILERSISHFDEMQLSFFELSAIYRSTSDFLSMGDILPTEIRRFRTEEGGAYPSRLVSLPSPLREDVYEIWMPLDPPAEYPLPDAWLLYKCNWERCGAGWSVGRSPVTFIGEAVSPLPNTARKLNLNEGDGWNDGPVCISWPTAYTFSPRTGVKIIDASHWRREALIRMNPYNGVSIFLTPEKIVFNYFA